MATRNQFDFLPSPDRFLDTITSPAVATPEGRAARARQLGFDVRGGQAIKRGPTGESYFTDLKEATFDPDPVTLLQQSGEAISSDARATQESANRFYAGNVGAQRGYEQAFEGGAKDILTGANREGDLLGDLGDEFGAAGDRIFKDATQGSQRFTEAGMRDIDQALRHSGDSISTARAAEGGYADASDELVETALAGMERRVESQMAMLAGGVGPDGQPMSPAARMQLKRQLTDDVNASAAAMYAQQKDRAATTLAGLRMAVSSAQAAAANVGLGAAEGRRRLGETDAQTKLSAEQMRQQYAGVRANLRTLATQTRETARALAAQLRIQGRGALASMISSNPETVVSLFSGFSQLASIASAPGGATFPGIRMRA